MAIVMIEPAELASLIETAVAKALSANQEQPKAQKYLSVTDLADLLKLKVSTVYQFHSRGQIPGARKLGGRLLFDSAEINAWIETGRIPTTAEKVSTWEKR